MKHMPQWLKRSLLVLVAVVALLYILILSFPVKARQDPSYHPLSVIPVDSLVLNRNQYNLDSLIQLTGTNKILPKGYELQALLALWVKS